MVLHSAARWKTIKGMKRMLLLGALMSTSAFSADSIYGFGLKTIDGKDMPLSAYKGKVVLLVNTASQ